MCIDTFPLSLETLRCVLNFVKLFWPEARGTVQLARVRPGLLSHRRVAFFNSTTISTPAIPFATTFGDALILFFIDLNPFVEDEASHGTG